MSTNPIILLSDDEEQQTTPLQPLSKRPRTDPEPKPGSDPVPILLIDDDPTPQKPGPITSSFATPLFVPETPLSDLSIVNCSTCKSDREVRGFGFKFSGGERLVFVDHENDVPESHPAIEETKEKEKSSVDVHDLTKDVDLSSSSFGPMDLDGGADLIRHSQMFTSVTDDRINQVFDDSEKENSGLDQKCDNLKQKGKKRVGCEAVGKKKMTKEERARLTEENKQKKELEKLQKQALKAQAAELKKLEKEKKQWEKGKFALKSIVAEFDTKVVEKGSVGGHLLSRFADKSLAYRITSNPIEQSIVWSMKVPEQLFELYPNGTEVQYVLFVFGAEEFCDLVRDGSLFKHVSRVQSHYPSFTVCYLTNKLMAYINKREKEQYKNPKNHNAWKSPPIDEALATLTTHFARVHYRMCTDEAELAEHVVGLTCSLAMCQFRKKLTWLSVSANGSIIPKDCIDRNLIKRSPWLKALVAIPKVQPRCAIAIWKKYPTMKFLLRVYMDPSKSVHEKECLLEDLTMEGLLGGERRVGKMCSKRVYRILMAENGSIKSDDVEDGADFFRSQESQSSIRL